MKTAAVALAAFAGAVLAAPQGPTLAGPPQDCSKDYNGQFEITLVKPSNIQNRDLAKRQSTCGQTGIITLQLSNGNLTDVDGRTGYIASKNQQFQFDKPVQAGGIYAGDFSVCKNGSLALGPTTTFYQCQSGGIYNLYYANTAPQCSPVNIDIIPCDGSSNGAGSSAAGPSSQTTAAPVSVSSDGQPQATVKATAVPVSAYTDGQPQATVAATSVAPAPVSEYTDGQPQATASATAANISVAASPKPTIATAGSSTLAASLSMAGLMAAFALLF